MDRPSLGFEPAGRPAGILPNNSSRVAIGPIAGVHGPLAHRRGMGLPSRLSQLTALSELVQPAQSSRAVPMSGFGVVS